MAPSRPARRDAATSSDEMVPGVGWRGWLQLATKRG